MRTEWTRHRYIEVGEEGTSATPVQIVFFLLFVPFLGDAGQKVWENLFFFSINGSMDEPAFCLITLFVHVAL